MDLRHRRIARERLRTGLKACLCDVHKRQPTRGIAGLQKRHFGLAKRALTVVIQGQLWGCALHDRRLGKDQQ
jgi:hypothetical protein